MVIIQWKNIIVLYKMPIHVLVCKGGCKTLCFVISISAAILKLMVKITSISSSYTFLRIAWHDIFSLSQHLLASWNNSSIYPPCCRVEEQMPFNAWTSQRLFKSNPQVNHRTHLKDCTPACLKFGKTSHPAVENLSHSTAQKWHWALF